MPNFIDAERQEDVLILRLNRPESLNALNTAMRDELWQYLMLLHDDLSIKSAVLDNLTNEILWNLSLISKLYRNLI